LWQAVVARLVKQVHVILFDISITTQHVHWEYSLLEEGLLPHAVFVANREADLVIRPPEGHACLLYDNLTERSGRKAFLDSLMRELDGRSKTPPPFNFREWIVEPVAACLRTLVALSITTIIVAHLVTAVASHLAGAGNP
jgi:hypothetical protein